MLHRVGIAHISTSRKCFQKVDDYTEKYNFHLFSFNYHFPHASRVIWVHPAAV